MHMVVIAKLQAGCLMRWCGTRLQFQ